MAKYKLSHLEELEAESIFVFREIASQFENPVLLFSGGKDSIVCFHLARKAFWPAKIPFSLMHIDTGHNFKETISFRDNLVKKYNCDLIIGSVEQSIQNGKVTEEKGINASRNNLQTTTLLDTLEEYNVDCAIGGARRDEEKARAKERFFSHRDDFGQWDPKNQRPELWFLLNGKKRIGEHFRAFPISNWTEIDVWQYIKENNIDIPSLYFSHERKVFLRNNILYADNDIMLKSDDDNVVSKKVRFRTIGDLTCTGAIESDASDLDSIIKEVSAARITERGGRIDDKRSESSMEDRKKQGYF
ncbi:sulfate adenylyltransferase subunit CysD [Candidatus Kapabacteria bacterium]|nr:sulfate adenylyltransferase subunit CysD [Candidatus Kapabacteria bacterium]